jgi:hypothetical protein
LSLYRLSYRRLCRTHVLQVFYVILTWKQIMRLKLQHRTNDNNSRHRCMISIFLRYVDKIFAILGCYTACSVHSLPLYLLHGAVFLNSLAY